MGVDINNLTTEREINSGMDLIVLKQPGHFRQIGHEDKAADPGIEVLDRVHELQHEPRDVAYRIRHVTEDDDLGLLFLLGIQDNLEGHPAILEVFPQRLLEVEPAALGPLAANRDHVLEPLRQLGHRLLHFPNFVLGQIIETLIRQAAHLLLVPQLGILLLQLGPHEAANHMGEVLEAAVQIGTQLLNLLGTEPGALQGLLEGRHLLSELAEPQPLGHGIGELPLLERPLDVLQVRSLRGFAQELLELTSLIREQRAGKLRELGAQVLQGVLELLKETLEFFLGHLQRIHG